MTAPKPWTDLNLKEKMMFILTQKTDCSFILNDGNGTKKIESYQSILMSESPVFNRMFTGNFQESTCPHDIKLTDIDAEDFEIFLEAIYYNKLDYESEKAIKVIYIAEKYMVKKVKILAEQLLSKELSRGSFYDFINIFNYAHEFENNDLKYQMNNYGKTFDIKCQMINSCTNLYDLKPKVFYDFIAFFYKKTSPKYPDKILFMIEMYYKIHKKSSNNVDDLNEVKILLKAAIAEFVRFEEMDPLFIKNCALKSDLLTSAQKMQLFSKCELKMEKFDETELIESKQTISVIPSLWFE